MGPPANGWTQILASASALRIQLATWFHDNPLAEHLSKSFGKCIHLWSLNSGFVAGYSAYTNGDKSECDSLFSPHAKGRRDLMKGVPTPTINVGGLLDRLLEMDFDFRSEMARFTNLEIGLANLISRKGFETHLIELHDAIDDKHGISVANDHYSFVPLQNWTYFRFISPG